MSFPASQVQVLAVYSRHRRIFQHCLDDGRKSCRIQVCWFLLFSRETIFHTQRTSSCLFCTLTLGLLRVS